MRPYILAETNWKTVKEEHYQLVVLPWGATEAHNYHLPYSTDNVEADALAAEAARIAWERGGKVIVLARDTRLQGPVIDAWISPVTDKDGYLNLELTGQNQQGFWMQFKVVCKYEPSIKESELQGPVTFCDYASAGNSYDERSRFRVWFPQLLDPRKMDK